MKKFLVPGILAALFLFLPARSQANPIDVPTGGGRISAPMTTTGNGFFVFTSTFNVQLTTPPVGYQYCVTHVAVTAPSQGFFEIWWSSQTTVAATGPMLGTTDYVVSLSTQVPYDSQWAYRSAYCAPFNDPLNFFTSASISTVTVEGYTFKGWNP
jgi:hypothetical protein